MTTRAWGGALYVNSGIVDIRNSILACNVTAAHCGPFHAGGGLFVNGGTVSMVNCTVARNDTATGIEHAGGWLDIRNSIVYFNNSSGQQIGGAPSVAFSDVQGSFPGTSNIDFHPAFKGIGCSVNDFQLVLGSPAIDAGDPATAFDDACFPLSLGTARNDQGAFGGPGACAWGRNLTLANLSVYNGAGANPLVYQGDTPLLGGPWEGVIDTNGRSGATEVVVFNYGRSRRPGYLLPRYGEVLVDWTSTRIGQPLCRPVGANGLARFQLLLPCVPALAGFELTSQAAILGGGPPRLTNALEMTLGY